MWAVVAREHRKRVLVEAVGLERVEQLADAPVHRADLVAEDAVGARVRPSEGSEHGDVALGEGEVVEEGLVVGRSASDEAGGVGNHRLGEVGMVDWLLHEGGVVVDEAHLRIGLIHVAAALIAGPVVREG